MTTEVRPRIRGLNPEPLAWPADSSPRAAAVLCLLLHPPESEEPWHILFTRRSTLVSSHRGQIGFPGGRREVWDSSPSSTALREAYEEIGLDPARVRILGSLEAVKSLDLHPVIPIVGEADVRLTELTPNPSEVAEVFSVPWTCFLPEAQEKLRFNLFGRWRETLLYPAAGYQIWGLTALMLHLARFERMSLS